MHLQSAYRNSTWISLDATTKTGWRKNVTFCLLISGEGSVLLIAICIALVYLRITDLPACEIKIDCWRILFFVTLRQSRCQ